MSNKPALAARPGEIMRFGQVNEGETLHFSLTLQNVSDRPVSIRKTASTCGCVVPKLDATTIAPGASVPLPVEFNTEGQGGETKKSVKVAYARDGEATEQLLSIGILGTVKARLYVNPRLVRFDEVRLGQSYTRSISVASDVYPAFRIGGVDVDNDEITASFERKFENGYELTFTFKPREERPCSSVVLRLAGHAFDKFSLPMTWTYHSAADAEPASIVGSALGTFETRLAITSRANGSLADAVVSLECENGELTLLDSSDSKREYSLKVRPGAPEAKSTAGQIRVDVPSDQEGVPLRIPILIAWRASSTDNEL